MTSINKKPKQCSLRVLSSHKLSNGFKLDKETNCWTYSGMDKDQLLAVMTKIIHNLNHDSDPITITLEGLNR